MDENALNKLQTLASWFLNKFSDNQEFQLGMTFAIVYQLIDAYKALLAQYAQSQADLAAALADDAADEATIAAAQEAAAAAQAVVDATKAQLDAALAQVSSLEATASEDSANFAAVEAAIKSILPTTPEDETPTEPSVTPA